jgi:hypothetical protein
LRGEEIVVGIVLEAPAEAVADAGLGGQVEDDVRPGQGRLPAVAQQVALQQVEAR